MKMTCTWICLFVYIASCASCYIACIICVQNTTCLCINIHFKMDVLTHN